MTGIKWFFPALSLSQYIDGYSTASPKFQSFSKKFELMHRTLYVDIPDWLRLFSYLLIADDHQHINRHEIVQLLYAKFGKTALESLSTEMNILLRERPLMTSKFFRLFNPSTLLSFIDEPYDILKVKWTNYVVPHF